MTVPLVMRERVDDEVTLLTLDRPERLNAITFELAAELHDALDEVAADDACRVAILAGAGRGFCAGLDLRDWEARMLATGIAGYTSIGLVLTKEAFWHNVANPSLAGAIALENRNQRLAGQTTEVQQYMASYSRRHRDKS